MTYILRAFRLLVLPSLIAWGTIAASDEPTVPTLPAYRIVPGISGEILAVGSDTMLELMTFWSEAFHAQYPAVSITLDEKGSNTAPLALIEGRSQLGPMSRPMKPDEVSAFTRRFGYPPTAIAVAIDGLAVFVHRDNPLPGLTLLQVEAIFSAVPSHGQPRITTWKSLGVNSLGEARLTLYGRNPLSGTYTFFKEQVLSSTDYSEDLREQPSSTAVIHSVATDATAIAYCGIGYATSGVRTIPIGLQPGEYVSPTQENCWIGTYPIARRLYIYVNRSPSGRLPPAVREFLRFVLSASGQEVVALGGFFPLPAESVLTSVELIGP